MEILKSISSSEYLGMPRLTKDSVHSSVDNYRTVIANNNCENDLEQINMFVLII